MKQLTDKELTILGAIGFLLQGFESEYLLLREKILEFGFQDQIEDFQEKMLSGGADLDTKVNNLLVQVATDIIEGESPYKEE